MIKINEEQFSYGLRKEYLNEELERLNQVIATED